MSNADLAELLVPWIREMLTERGLEAGAITAVRSPTEDAEELAVWWWPAGSDPRVSASHARLLLPETLFRRGHMEVHSRIMHWVESWLPRALAARPRFRRFSRHTGRSV